MASYVVLEPPEAPDRVERAVLVRDGFAFFAFLVPFLWFLWHRMWIEAILVILATIAIAVLGGQLGHASLGTLLSLLLAFFIGVEAQNFRVNALRRRGWNVWGVVEGRDREEAELRYAAEVEPTSEQRPAAAPPSAPATMRPHGKGPKASSSFGLLVYPRRS
ncbi:DUF2628 domain-containing protein [Chelativorans sp. YIM 93263]|uniref:DUF2628 domain-containing protein n=1 Tax=Chelativorans sp. YIM 93263 TaxID=2906648 RepID=UPI002377FD86|nr:DUF2628 domain-containing protein [Chelativorans sp. YIM 93263]